MTIERFMLDGFRDQEAYETLSGSNTFPLVRELEFKYGLKVIRAESIRLPKDHVLVDGWLMSYKNGVPVANAFSYISDGKLMYAVYMRGYRKGKAFDEHDRAILTSNKISQLMTSIKRTNAMPNEDKVIRTRVLDQITAVFQYKRSVRGNKRKGSPFEIEEIHAMLARVLGENTNTKLLPLDLDKCKKALDVFNDYDKMVEDMEKECAELFEKPFLLVGMYENGETIAGKAVVDVPDGITDTKYKLTEQLKRYRSAADVEGFKAIMTMIKLKYEDSVIRRVGGFLPLTDAYDPDLQVAFFYSTNPNNYDCAWVAVPCTT